MTDTLRLHIDCLIDIDPEHQMGQRLYHCPHDRSFIVQAAGFHKKKGQPKYSVYKEWIRPDESG